MKNKRILVFTLLMSALLVFSAMPAYSFTEFYLGADSTESAESGTAVESPAGTPVASTTTADDITDMQQTDVSAATDKAALVTLLTAEVTNITTKGFAPTGTLQVSAEDFIAALVQVANGTEIKAFNLSQVTFKEASDVKLDLSDVNTPAISFVDKDGNTTDAKKVIEVTLPDNLQEFNGTGTSLTTLKLTTKLTTVVLRNVTTLTTLSNLDKLTELVVLNLYGATALEDSLKFASDTVLEQLDLTGAAKLLGVDLSAATKAKILQLSGLTKTTEGSVVLPSAAASLATLNVKGGHFALINASRFTALTAAEFIATEQTVTRSDTKVKGGVLALKDLFPSTYTTAEDVTVAADEDKTATLANIKTVTANSGKVKGTLGSDNDVAFDTTATISSIEYEYTVSDANGDDLTTSVAASGVSSEEGSTNTVGGSGGGCSAGFGALALAAVAAFLLKKSR